MGSRRKRLLDVQLHPDAERPPVPDRWLSRKFPGRGIPWPDASFSIGAASNHPGGCNVLFADGSVKFVKDSINRMTWWSLGTKAGGEVISSDAY